MNRKDLVERLNGVRTRGQVKKLGAEADKCEELHGALLLYAADNGVCVANDWTGKRLVRAVLNREESAQERKNPIRVDAAFRCVQCGLMTPIGGRMVRDHCPRCLRSVHVDCVPGDRAAGCGGVMDPFQMTLEGRSGVILTSRCRKCGHEHRCRAHPDDAVPPSLDPKDVFSEMTAKEGGNIPDRARTLPMRVLEVIRRERLWSPGDFVIVAVSGGMDSTVLLELLARTGGAHGGKLEVASIDHGLRPEAVAEVAGVGRQAKGLGLPFHGLSVDLNAGSNLASRARDARRAALIAVLGGRPGRICTAHHEDDQAETVLQNLLRGAGGSGLRGMQYADPPWCRPLLAESRENIHGWAVSQGLRWVEDPSNPGSQRGRIRKLMPELDQLHGGATGALARSARLIARDDAYLAGRVQEIWPEVVRGDGLLISALRALHPALQVRVLRHFIAQHQGEVIPRADQVEAFLRWDAPEGGQLLLGGGAHLVAVEGTLLWATDKPS